ncbi:MAG: DOMON-like domain-containing protein [Nitrospirota bacterium]
MTGHSFALRPFAPDNSGPGLKITGNISRSSNILVIRYELSCPLQEIVIPQPSDMPVRRNLLWEETCFEFFLGTEKSESYREFNLSPSGHWNVYYFRSYRQEMKEDAAVSSLPFSVKKDSDILKLELELNLDRIVPAEQPLNAAVSAVIKHTNGRTTYWALTHPGQKADFHLRDGFILEL